MSHNPSSDFPCMVYRGASEQRTVVSKTELDRAISEGWSVHPIVGAKKSPPPMDTDRNPQHTVATLPENNDPKPGVFNRESRVDPAPLKRATKAAL